MSIAELEQAIREGDEAEAEALTKELIEAGVEPERILNDAMKAAMEEVGRQFEANEIYIPEMLLASRAMKAGMTHLEPLLATGEAEADGTVVLGTVEGDVHDIGKNLVGMMLEGSGFKVVDLGTEVPPERFLEAAREEDADIVGMSALLTTTRPMMGETLELFREAGEPDVKVMVGGTCVTQGYADEIQADGYAASASEAVSKARDILAA